MEWWKDEKINENGEVTSWLKDYRHQWGLNAVPSINPDTATIPTTTVPEEISNVIYVDFINKRRVK